MDNFREKFYYLLGKKNANRVKYFRMKQRKKVNEQLKGNKEFYNIHSGKRCFILGNGPSISKIDFEKLSKEYTFTVNQFSRFNNFEKLNSNYHVFADERIFSLDENNEVDVEALEYFRKLKKVKGTKFFSKLNSKAYIESSKYFKNIDVSYYYDGLEMFDGYNIDVDITKQIPWFPTVVHYCIFLAMYMGFTEIYLLGCECTGFLKVMSINNDINDNSTYGYKVTDKETKRIKKQLKTFGIADELELCANVFRYYEYIEKFASSRGVKIVNCTDGGILNSFKRKKLDDVLKLK